MQRGRISSYVTLKWIEDFLNVYISLHSSDPDVDDPFLSEITGHGYRRMRTDMTIVSDRAVVNASDLRFTNLPATLITHLGIWDSEVNGSIMASVPLESAMRTIVGASLVLPANNIAVSIA